MWLTSKTLTCYSLLVTILFSACKKDKTTTGTASISALNCSSVIFSNSATANISYTGTATITYTGGNSVAYTSGSSIASTGVSGLTATLNAGSLANGSGNLVYNITGTPSAAGTASFAISFASQSCTLNLAVNAAGSTVATVSNLNCSNATSSGSAAINTAFTGTISVPYTGGNGLSYAAGTTISSTGVSGLSATLVAGNLVNGGGNIVYTISGTPTTTGTASFAITFGGQSCTISLNVASTTAGCSSLSGVAKLICLCDAFKATLTSTQIAQLQLSYTFANIKTWSNLPASMSARLGIPFSSLSFTQLTAAKAIVEQMSGTTTNEGWDEVQQLWLADNYLQSNGGGSTYGSGNYYIAFFGTPASTGQFEIMMTGHHKTVANTYKDGAFISATPHFTATEPLTWTTNSVSYAPMNQEQTAFTALIAGLTTTQYNTAHTTTTYSDLLLGPSANWSFPTTNSGLQCNGLSTTQKTLVMNAIKTYVNDVDNTNAASINSLYESELDNTYILHSGTVNMNTRNDYIRISGPHVWIEFSVQNGIVLSGVHYHSVWRDRVNDYGTTR